MSVLKVGAIQNTSGVEVYTAKAWVSFNGTGVVAIRADGNVTSITDNGVGDYTVNFTVAMIDANYAVSASMAALNGTSIRAIAGGPNYSQTVSGCRIQTWSNSAVQDSEFVSIAIFR